MAEKVEHFRNKLDTGKLLAETTKRSKVLLHFIRSQNCQENVPIVGRLVEKALAEPLHNTNNAQQYFNKQLFFLVNDISQIQH